MKNYELPEASIRLVKGAPMLSSTPVNTALNAVRLVGEQLSEMDREVLCVINLNAKKMPINYSIVSIGSLNSSEACVREVFKSSILSNASGMILLHNHPSGSEEPSGADYQVTDRMVQAGALLEIEVIDHIIVAGENFYSMKNEDTLPEASLTFGFPDFAYVAGCMES